MRAPQASLRLKLARAGATLAVLVLVAGGAWYGYAEIVSRPIERVVFAGDYGKLAAADLDGFAQSVRRAGGSRIEAVREAARAMPGVRDASVRRRFPDVVEVSFEAHEPLARWGEHAMVSVLGEVYSAPVDAKRPILRGPDGAAARMAAELPGLVKAAAPLGSPLAELRLSARGAWEAQLASGLVLALGRGDIVPRLARFALLWPQVSPRAAHATVADLRYANGFALRAGSKSPPGRT
jgi:cell division protein FtsQ